MSQSYICSAWVKVLEKYILKKYDIGRIYPIEWGNFVKAAEFTPVHGCN